MRLLSRQKRSEAACALILTECFLSLQRKDPYGEKYEKQCVKYKCYAYLHE